MKANVYHGCSDLLLLERRSQHLHEDPEPKKEQHVPCVPCAHERPARQEKQQIRSLNETRGDRRAEQTVSCAWNSTGDSLDKVTHRERVGVSFKHLFFPHPHPLPHFQTRCSKGGRGARRLRSQAPPRGSPMAGRPQRRCSASGCPPSCPTPVALQAQDWNQTSTEAASRRQGCKNTALSRLTPWSVRVLQEGPPTRSFSGPCTQVTGGRPSHRLSVGGRSLRPHPQAHHSLWGALRPCALQGPATALWALGSPAALRQCPSTRGAR